MILKEFLNTHARGYRKITLTIERIPNDEIIQYKVDVDMDPPEKSFHVVLNVTNELVQSLGEDNILNQMLDHSHIDFDDMEIKNEIIEGE